MLWRAFNPTISLDAHSRDVRPPAPSPPSASPVANLVLPYSSRAVFCRLIRCAALWNVRQVLVKEIILKSDTDKNNVISYTEFAVLYFSLSTAPACAVLNVVTVLHGGAVESGDCRFPLLKRN